MKATQKFHPPKAILPIQAFVLFRYLKKPKRAANPNSKKKAKKRRAQGPPSFIQKS
jgi:hypothetical protein